MISARRTSRTCSAITCSTLVGKEFLAAGLEDPNRRAEYLLPEPAHE